VFHENVPSVEGLLSPAGSALRPNDCNRSTSLLQIAAKTLPVDWRKRQTRKSRAEISPLLMRLLLDDLIVAEVTAASTPPQQ